MATSYKKRQIIRVIGASDLEVEHPETQANQVKFTDANNIPTTKTIAGSTVSDIDSAISALDSAIEGAGKIDDVKISNGTTSTTVVENKIAEIVTDGTYNSDTNKIATQTTVTNYHDSTKQNTISNGDAIRIDDGTEINVEYDNSTIVLDGNKLKVGTIAESQVSGLVNDLAGKEASGTAAGLISAHNSANDTHSDIRTLANNAQTKADSAYSLAEGREKAITYDTYQLMVSAFNGESSSSLKVGDNVFIRTVEVPDLWINKVNQSKTTYTYSDDATIVSIIRTNGYIEIGYYKLSQLESSKVDLSGYVPTTRKVNNKALSSDITLNASDVSALPSSTKYGASLSVNGTSVQLKDQDGNNLGSPITTQDTTYNVATTSSNGLMSSSDKEKLDGIASGAEVNVQSDWNQTDNTKDDYIKNKPSITVVDNGSGNAVTDVTSSGHTITLTRGANFLTENQTITLSGDLSGSGKTSITTTIGDNKVTTAKIATPTATAGELASNGYSAFKVNSKDQIIAKGYAIEWGDTTTSTPSDDLMDGGLFFLLQS